MFILLVLACQTEAPQPATIEEPVVVEPVVVAEEATPEAPPAPAVTKRSDCTFVDENRTEDDAGRVTVNCNGEVLQAKAIYVPGGSFDFEVEVPAAVVATP